jgi:hypothetical protein
LRIAHPGGGQHERREPTVGRDGSDGVVLLEANDEWLLQYRYMQTEATAEKNPPAPTNTQHFM